MKFFNVQSIKLNLKLLISTLRTKISDFKKRLLIKLNYKPLVHINISLFTANVSKSSSNTLDGSHCEHDFLLPIDVCVQHTQNVLKFFVRHQRLSHIAKNYRISAETTISCAKRDESRSETYHFYLAAVDSSNDCRQDCESRWPIEIVKEILGFVKMDYI
jgi:hypothetical protein